MKNRQSNVVSEYVSLLESEDRFPAEDLATDLQSLQSAINKLWNGAKYDLVVRHEKYVKRDMMRLLDTINTRVAELRAVLAKQQN
jgi:hypothetical protein